MEAAWHEISHRQTQQFIAKLVAIANLVLLFYLDKILFVDINTPIRLYVLFYVLFLFLSPYTYSWEL